MLLSLSLCSTFPYLSVKFRQCKAFGMFSRQSTVRAAGHKKSSMPCTGPAILNCSSAKWWSLFAPAWVNLDGDTVNMGCMLVLPSVHVCG